MSYEEIEPEAPRGSGRSGRATLADVARLAGVSGKTVSRAINGDAAISPETKDRVFAAIEALNYRPNLAARSLRSYKSFTLCLLTKYIGSAYFTEIVRGATRACTARNHHLVIEELPADKPTRQSMAELMARVPLDGFVLFPPLTDDPDLLEALECAGMPYVRLSPATHRERSPLVEADDAKGVGDLVQYLWRLGHRRFGVIAGPANHAASHIRRDSFIQAVVEHGGATSDVSVFDIPQHLIDEFSQRRASRQFALIGTLAVDMFLAQRPRPTAVFAFSDEIAAGVLTRALQLGVAVPQDMAIAGFDDSDVSEIVYPPLTTISQPVAEMAADAVNMLIDGAAPGAGRTHEVGLVVRRSTDSDGEAGS